MKNILKLLIISCLLLPNLIWAQACETKFDYYKRGKDVVFFGNSTSHSPYYAWNLGDGSGWQYTFEDHISTSYSNPGTYYVCLRDSFCPTSSLFCDSVRISNDIPVYADFSYTLESTGKITVYNEASSSSPIIQHYWDFGDGTALEGEADSMVHQYHTSGTYTVCMYAFDQQKNYNNQCSTVTVFVPEPCYADFTRAIANGANYFLNQSVFSGTNDSWFWNFGDSTTSTEKNPIHTYATEGTYEVSLTLTGPCSSTVKKSFYIPDSRVCNLKVSASTINQRASITIEDTANFNGIYYIEFGDGQALTTSEKNVSHVYPDTGDYTIMVQNLHSLCGEIYGYTIARVTSLEPICISAFYAYAGDTSGNKAFIISNAQIAANGNNKSYITIKWGDGKVEIDSTNQGFYQHEYDSAGIYTIHMIVGNRVNCADTSFKTIGVGPVYLVSGIVKQGNNPAAYSTVNAFMFEPQSGLLSHGFTTFTNDSGYYEMLLRKGYYIFQTDFAFDPTSTDFYLPTYYGDKLNWTNSDVLTIVGPRSNLNINQIPFTPINLNGGKIAGKAVYGRNVKDNGVTIPEGKPADKMLVFLLDAAGKPIAFTHTDASGDFEFKNMGAGNFTVWAEMPGKMTLPPYVYLQNSNATANDIKIIIGQNTVNSVSENTKLTPSLGFEMYPNPAASLVNIVLNDKASKISSIELIDQMGKSIKIEIFQEDNMASLNIASVQDGIYTLRMIDNEGNVLIKKLIKQVY